MALQLALEIDNCGLTATYWRIRRVDADFPAQSGDAVIQVTLEGWISQAVREEGKNPLPESRRVYRLVRASPAEVDGLTTADLYSALKLEPDLQGAIDV